MKDLTIQQLINMVFQVNKEPILAPFGFSFVVADPSLLTPSEAIDGRFHMFFHCTTGVYHFASDDGIHFEKVQKVVSNAMRPNINKIGDKYILYFEKTRNLLANGLNLINLTKWRSEIYACTSEDLVHWDKPQPVIVDACGYENSERGKSISNPFMLRMGDKYRLYYSCGLTFIKDCGFCEPTYVSYAESNSPIEGFTPVEKPIISPDVNNEYLNLCSGCLKVYALKDGYIGIQNGIFEKDGNSHSAILMLSSPDGIHFDFEKVLVEPDSNDSKSWMHQYVYASHLIRYGDVLRLYFNARDTSNMIQGRECIGYAEAKIKI